MALLTLVMGISNGMVGVAVDSLEMTVQSIILWMSGLYIIPGILWVLFLTFMSQFKKKKVVKAYP